MEQVIESNLIMVLLWHMASSFWELADILGETWSLIL